MPSSSIVLIFCPNKLAGGRDRVDTVSTYEVDTDGGDVRFCVGVVGEPQQQAGFSDTRVADKQELEEVVVSGGNISTLGGDSGWPDRCSDCKRRR